MTNFIQSVLFNQQNGQQQEQDQQVICSSLSCHLPVGFTKMKK